MNAEARERRKCSLAAEMLQSSGTLQLRATGTSMLPTLWPGDLLTIQSDSFDRVEAGDIALYIREGRFFVHRVVSKPEAKDQQRFLITRGDCMSKADPPVSSGQLLGRVAKIWRNDLFFTPARELTPLRRILAWTLCHCNLFRRVGLRLNARRNFPGSHCEAAVARAAS